MKKPDANHHADAKTAAIEALVGALAAELGPLRYATVGILGRPWLQRLAERQLAALLRLPLPTRAALLDEPR